MASIVLVYGVTVLGIVGFFAWNIWSSKRDYQKRQERLAAQEAAQIEAMCASFRLTVDRAIDGLSDDWSMHGLNTDAD